MHRRPTSSSRLIRLYPPPHVVHYPSVPHHYSLRLPPRSRCVVHVRHVVHTYLHSHPLSTLSPNLLPLPIQTHQPRSSYPFSIAISIPVPIPISTTPVLIAITSFPTPHHHPL